MNNKYSGVLMHISSLPNKQGIGTFGKQAYKFVDFLKKSGQTYWQILPLGHTSYGDSPYQSFSAFAGNPYFIDLELLEEQGLLKRQEYIDIDWQSQDDCVNYGVLYEKRYPLLRKAVKRFVDNENFLKFCQDNDWLDDYALFMALKDKFKGKEWLKWPRRYRLRDEQTILEFKNKYAANIRFWKVVQYLFDTQWHNLKEYANSLGIRIFGDCPIYVALDSADVWSQKKNFKLRNNGIPREVAGVPPDAFSETGQLWGNPLYNWKYLKENHYDFWIKRIKQLFKLYDAVRIDHFIGIESYYAIKYGQTDARIGKRYKGPGYDLIKTIKQEIGDCEIIAEDLGVVTDKVRRLLKRSGYPGMKVLRYGFGSGMDNEHLTHNHPKNSVIYITSHDSETCMQWYDEAPEYEINFAKEYCQMDPKEAFNWSMIKELEKSEAYLTIIQAQDLIGLGKEARMNYPSTLGTNWCWRAIDGQLNDDIAQKLFKITKENRRVHD